VATFCAALWLTFTLPLTLKTLGGLTPYEYICKIWTSEPDRFILDPIHQMPGLNNLKAYRTASSLRSKKGDPATKGAV
jgi:hypothetical protein